jgi:hypothetical protein
MSTSNRLMLGLIALAAGLSAVHLALSGRLGPMEPRRDRVALGSWRVEPPPKQTKVVFRRGQKKAEVIEELLRGKLTLLEAAAWFRFLNDNPPDYPARFREAFPGRSDGEKACRNVLQWLSATGCSKGEQKPNPDVLASLHAELDALLAQRAAVELPW